MFGFKCSSCCSLLLVSFSLSLLLTLIAHVQAAAAALSSARPGDLLSGVPKELLNNPQLQQQMQFAFANMRQ